jgi:hypothetical protein
MVMALPICKKPWTLPKLYQILNDMIASKNPIIQEYENWGRGIEGKVGVILDY